MAVRSLLAPLRLLRVPVSEIGKLELLMSPSGLVAVEDSAGSLNQFWLRCCATNTQTWPAITVLVVQSSCSGIPDLVA